MARTNVVGSDEAFSGQTIDFCKSVAGHLVSANPELSRSFRDRWRVLEGGSRLTAGGPLQLEQPSRTTRTTGKPYCIKSVSAKFKGCQYAVRSKIANFKGLKNNGIYSSYLRRTDR